MKSIPINHLPILLESKAITEKEAVDSLAEFICLNYPVFGLQNYSEDFRSEILVKLLEKGAIIFRTYNKSKGDFFNYFYCYINTMIKSELKSLSRRNMNEKVFQNHCADAYPENQYSYSRISPTDYDAPKIPYSFKPITPENLKAAFHSLPDRNAKMNVVLALKAAYYLNDEIISDLCHSYNLDRNDFIENVQICKNTLLDKNERNQEAIERRNKSYFYHKRYEYQLDKMFKNDDFFEVPHVQKLLEKKDSNQKKRWKNQNLKLNDKRMGLRTSNKIIANLLNLCERQVGYYLLKSIENYDEESPHKD